MSISNVVPYRPAQTLSNPLIQSSATAASGDVDLEFHEAGVDLEQVRSTAISALRNPRFGRVLDQLMDPRASEMLAFMRQTDGPTGTDHESARSRYVENNG